MPALSGWAFDVSAAPPYVGAGPDQTRGGPRAGCLVGDGCEPGTKGEHHGSLIT
jgi:hypothetical protein